MKCHLVTWSLLWLGCKGKFDARFVLPSLKLTAKAPENRWLEYDRFLLGRGLFSGAKMFVSGRVIFFSGLFWWFSQLFWWFSQLAFHWHLGWRSIPTYYLSSIHAKLCQNCYHLLPSKGQYNTIFIPVRGRFVSQHHSSHWLFAEIRFLMLHNGHRGEFGVGALATVKLWTRFGTEKPPKNGPKMCNFTLQPPAQSLCLYHWPSTLGFLMVSAPQEIDVLKSWLY